MGNLFYKGQFDDKKGSQVAKGFTGNGAPMGFDDPADHIEPKAAAGDLLCFCLFTTVKGFEDLLSFLPGNTWAMISDCQDGPLLLFLPEIYPQEGPFPGVL
jgi:hypothetical protein